MSRYLDDSKLAGRQRRRGRHRWGRVAIMALDLEVLAMLCASDIERVVCETVPAYGVARAMLFGSYARNEQDERSDVDLVLELGRPLGFKRAELCELLGQRLGVPVDVIFGEEQLCEPVRRQFECDRMVLYEG